MRKSVVAGAALVVVSAAVALFFLLSQGDAPAGLTLGPVAEPAAEGPAAAKRGTARPEQPESRQVEAIRPTSFVDPEVAAATRTAADDDGLRVLVVEETTGLPVPEAEVAYSDGRADAESYRGVHVNPSSVVADFDHAPLRALADERGVALIRTSPRLVIAARSGAMFGSRSFNQPQPPKGEVRVSIQAGVFLAARVVTAGGEPVPGMLVRLDVQQQRGDGRRGGTISRTVNAVSRSPDGIAIGEHMPAKPDDANNPVEVSAILEGSPQKEAVKVPLGKLKDGPITLVTGPTGRLTVKLQEPDGKPYLGDARLSLTVTRNKLWTELRAAASGGTASFPWVPVGATLALSAEPEGFDSVQGLKAGPLSNDGESQTVELRFARKRALLAGRAVNESGTPLCGVTMQAEILASNGTLVFRTPASVTTDGLGVFKIPIDRVAARDSGCELDLEVRGGADRVDRHGFVTLPKLSEADEIALGDVKLARPEAIASGVVEDELGAPVPGALVIAEQLRLAAAARSGSFVAGKRSFSPADRLRARTNEAGAFEIPLPLRPRSRPSSFTLRAEAEGHVCTAAVDGVQPGAKLVKIVVRGTGVIQGRLLLPDPAPVRKIEIVVRRPAADAPAIQKFADCVNSDGSFALRGVLPGAVTVAVRRSPPGVDLADVGDVMVPRLAATDDARLRALDLREHHALRP